MMSCALGPTVCPSIRRNGPGICCHSFTGRDSSVGHDAWVHGSVDRCETEDLHEEVALVWCPRLPRDCPWHLASRWHRDTLNCYMNAGSHGKCRSMWDVWRLSVHCTDISGRCRILGTGVAPDIPGDIAKGGRKGYCLIMRKDSDSSEGCLRQITQATAIFSNLPFVFPKFGPSPCLSQSQRWSRVNGAADDPPRCY